MQPTPYTLPLPKFLAYCGLGETTVRKLIADGEIETAVISNRRAIIVPSYHAYVERQQAKPEQDARRNKGGAIPLMGTRRIRTNAIAK